MAEARVDREQPHRTECETGSQIFPRRSSRDLNLYRDPFSMLSDLQRQMERPFELDREI